MTRTSLAEQTAELRANSASRNTPESAAAFAEEQRQLTEAGVPAGVAEPGTPLPDADLVDAHGKPTTMRETLAGKPAVVVFYRGTWCPYCNLALRAYQAELVEPLTERGAALIAISPQTPTTHCPPRRPTN